MTSYVKPQSFGRAILAMALLSSVWLTAGCASTRVVKIDGIPWDHRVPARVLEVCSSGNEFSNAGVKCLDQGEYGQAAECFKAAISEKPNDHASHFGLGVAYDMQDQREKAAENYAIALQLRPTELKYRRALREASPKPTDTSPAPVQMAASPGQQNK